MWLTVWTAMVAVWTLLFWMGGHRVAVPWSVACQLVASFLTAVSGWYAARDFEQRRMVHVMYWTDWTVLFVLLFGLVALPVAFGRSPDLVLASAFLAIPLFSETLRALARMRKARTRTTFEGLVRVFE
jgi:hypothetical protein